MFNYEGDNTRIKNAVNDCNNLIRTNSFLTHILSKGKFDMANCDSRVIVTLIEVFIAGKFGPLNVDLYRSTNPWSRAYGYFNPSKPDYIFLNSRKLNRSNASICASLVHEMIHFLDSKSEYSFGHGSNNPKGKDDTAPYWIDNLAEYRLRILEKSESFAHKIVTPWYYKLYNLIKWW